MVLRIDDIIGTHRERKEIMRKKMSVLAFLLLSAYVLAGCGSKNEAAPKEETPALKTETEASVEPKQELDEEETVKDAGISVVETGFSAEIPDSVNASPVIVGEKGVYFIGENRVIIMDSETGDARTLWEGERVDGWDEMNATTGGKGILLKDNLYFLNTYYVKNEDGFTVPNYALVRLSSDGSESEVVYNYGEEYANYNMYFADGKLYVDASGVSDRITINADGRVENITDSSLASSSVAVPDDYRMVTYVNNGNQTAFPDDTIKNNGKMVLINQDYEYVLYDKDGSTSLLGGEVSSYYNGKLLINKNTDDYSGYDYGIVDMKSGEYTYLCYSDNIFSIVAMDDDYVYTSEDAQDGRSTVYNKINLKSGKIDMLLDKQYSEDSSDVYVNGTMPCVLDGKLYTITSENYAMYNAIIDLSTKEETVSGEAYYDSGISQVGKLERFTEEYTAPDGTVLMTVKAEVLKVSDRYAGAAKINAAMSEVLDNLSDHDADRQEAMTWYEDAGEDNAWFPSYSFDTEVSKITYLDEKVLGFEMNGYDYYGGAHGMPSKTNYLFDLETGERLTLGDLVTVSEEELDSIVIDAYKNNGEWEYYWEESENTIAEGISYETTDFTVTEDGLKFYFHPYALASYAQGFTYATVPYDKLGISYPLKNYATK